MTDENGHWPKWVDNVSNALIKTIEFIFPGSIERNNNKFNSGYDFANYLSMGMAGTVKGSIAPEKPLSLQHWVDSACTVLLMVPLIKGSGAGISKVAGKAKTPPKNAGTPFKTGQRLNTIQIGVDPGTLKINTAINPIKYEAAKAKINSNGMYGIVEVYSNGTIYNGNHRSLIGIQFGIPVDTIVIFN